MWLSEQKPAMFVYKLKFILLSQLIATLNNYARSLPSLPIVNWSASPECFFRPCKSMTGEMVPMESSIWQWGGDITPFGSGELILFPLSAHICPGLVVEYWPLWVHMDIIATLNSTNVSSCFFVLAFYHHPPTPPPTPPTPPPHPSYPPPYIIYWPNINEFHENKLKFLYLKKPGAANIIP